MQSQKNILMLIAGGLILLGAILSFIAFALVGFNWNGLNSGSPDEEKNYTHDLNGVNGLVVTGIDDTVVVTGSDDDQIKIHYFENDQSTYQIELTPNGELRINHSILDNWRNHIGFHFDTRKSTITISVPRTFHGLITASSISGDLKLADLQNLDTVIVSTASGEINLNHLLVNNQISASNTSGSLTLENVTANGNLDLATASGETVLKLATIKGNMSATSISGAIDLSETTVTGNISLESSSGELLFNKLRSDHLTLSTISSSISGTLLGDSANYTIKASSLSGDLNLPRSGNGNKMLDVSSTSGDVDIDFSPVN